MGIVGHDTDYHWGLWYIYTLSRMRGCMTNSNGFWIWWLDLLALLYYYNQLWQLTINYCLRLAPFLTGPRVASLRMTNHESLLTHWTPSEWITTPVSRMLYEEYLKLSLSLSLILLPMVSQPVYLGLRWKYAAPPPHGFTWNSSQSQSYIATDGRSISKSWCRAPSGAHDQIFIIVW
jgi:hypothetical protein